MDMPAGIALERSAGRGGARGADRQARARWRRGALRHRLCGPQFTDTEPLYGDQYAQVLVSLQPRRGVLRETAEVIDALRAPVASVPGEAKVSFSNSGRPAHRRRSARRSRPTITASCALPPMAARGGGTDPGVKDLTDDDVPGRTEPSLVLNREKLANAGVGAGEVSRLLRLHGEGETVASTRDGGEKVDVVVRARPGGADGHRPAPAAHRAARRWRQRAALGLV